MDLLKWIFAIVLCCWTSTFSQAQITADSTMNRSYRATRTDTPPVINGIPDEECWNSTGDWSANFVQQRPNEGQPTTEETSVKILYDDHNLYVAFHCFDSEPDKINRWLAPRDQMTGDFFCVIFDSYNDRRTGFSFALTAGGTKADFLTFNNDNDDETWNAVWEGKVSHDTKGWYGEFRIPLSQLRYANTEGEQEWGFTAVRYIARKNEQTFIHLITQQNSGFVYSLSRLTGLSGLTKSRRIELAPYTTVKYQLSQKDEDNPYSKSSEWKFGAGLDGKVGLSSDFTLDFSINPDFGQVEADPSTINLTAYETWYDEKRPFFLEGKNIFNNSGESMFYSRRIGSRTLWQPDDQDGRYISEPKEAAIISALKVSGKNKNGLSIGVLNSLTAKGSTKINDSGHEYAMTSQPFASYSVARVQKDIKQGNTIIGGFLTSTNRNLNEEHLKGLIKNAYAGAIDFEQYFLKRNYFVRGILQYSSVEGSQAAITDLQRSPVHFYHREGVTHLGVDSFKTTLQGHGGRVVLGKRGQNAKIISEQRFSWASPGFDINNLGYIQQADYKKFNGFVGYYETKPQGMFNSYFLDVFYMYETDFGNMPLFGRIGTESELSFKNNYFAYICAFYDTKQIEKSILRGGPPVNVNPRWGTDLSIRTDRSKRLIVNFYHGTVFGDIRYAQFFSTQLDYRPIPNLNISTRLEGTHWNKKLEYVAAPTITNNSGKKAYIMGSLRQETMSLTLRMDYSITPEFSIQFYGNPFVSSGKYTDFKLATNTMDKTYENRFHLFQPHEITYNSADNQYAVNQEGQSQSLYIFDNPNFSFREFRFNLVARWEYRPNSILYLVWAQDRSGRSSDYTSSLSQNTKALFNYYPGNVLMLKLNYWFSM